MPPDLTPLVTIIGITSPTKKGGGGGYIFSSFLFEISQKKSTGLWYYVFSISALYQNRLLWLCIFCQKRVIIIVCTWHCLLCLLPNNSTHTNHAARCVPWPPKHHIFLSCVHFKEKGGGRGGKIWGRGSSEDILEIRWFLERFCCVYSKTLYVKCENRLLIGWYFVILVKLL